LADRSKARVPRHYRLHGLTIASELEYPQLIPIASAPPDVSIVFGPVCEAVPDAAAQFRNWTALPGQMTITAFDIARFSIVGGKTITIDPLPGAAPADLVSFSLGSCMSALLQQRELLPLHASSVATEHGALLITGRSGAGKSTLVAQLTELGLPLLADDVTAIGLDEQGQVQALPGLPAMRLWQDSLTTFGKANQATLRVRDDLEKFYLSAANFCDRPLPIAGIVRLTSKREGPPEVSEPGRAEAIGLLSHHVHRKHFLRGMGLLGFAFDRTSAIARTAPMLQIVRGGHGSPPDMLARIALDWLAERKRSQ
jgi:hypothetical protein